MPTLALTEATAGHLKRKLGELPAVGGNRGRGVGGSRVVFVRCTSEDSVEGSGVGAECYPGVIVRPAAPGLIAAQEDAGEVWLSIIDGGTAAEPVADTVYPCLLTGEIELIQDGTPQTKPRAFGTPSAAGAAAQTVATGASDRTGTISATFEPDPKGILTLAPGKYLIIAHGFTLITSVDGSNRCVNYVGFQDWDAAVSRPLGSQTIRHKANLDVRASTLISPSSNFPFSIHGVYEFTGNRKVACADQTISGGAVSHVSTITAIPVI